MSISAKDISGGSGGSMDALALLANPEKLKQRIEAFNSAESAAKEQIALAGPASEIVAIREGIETVRAETDAVLSEANSEADKIVRDAGETASQMVSEAENDAHIVEQDAAEKVRQAEARVAGIKTHESAVQRQVEVAGQRSAELDRLGEELQQKADALDKRAQELDGEREKLAEVRGLIDNIL